MTTKVQHCCSLAAAVLLLLPLVLGASADTDFDFFYHVQQWPGSYCATELGCCIPSNQKPAADFGIHGLWAQYTVCRTVNNESRCWPDSCNASDPLDLSQIRDMEADLLRNWGTLSCKSKDATAFWDHEWRRHGTCSGMDQSAYFRAALEFKARFNLTRALLDAGIAPSDDRTYSASSVRDAVARATGYAPNLECNVNERNETQLYQVYQCVDVEGRHPVVCPVTMDGGCSDMVKFPVFHAPGANGATMIDVQPAGSGGQDEL